VAGRAGTKREAVVAGLIVAWSVRLGWHIGQRSRGAANDPRYEFLRHEWGERFQPRLFWFLQIQALCAWVLAMSVGLAARNAAPLGVWDVLAVAVAAIAIIGEAVADAQLQRYRADPANRGGICDAGLWRWSRHPNYFFEWLGWVAYPVFAIGGDAAGWLALAGPVLMYWLLVHASGIPPLEAHMLRSRGDAFRDYQARTSAFFPLPPKG
jgi:steroid 5-alpha reductase family enzyme